MTIDEAIRNHKENIEIRSKIENMDNIDKYVIECDKKYVEWLEELKKIKEMDLEIPQHFTKEQSEWIKAYCIRRNKEFYNKAIDNFQDWLKTQIVGIDNQSKEILVVNGDRWELAIDKYKESGKNDRD